MAKKFLFTFDVGSSHKGKCVIIKSNDEVKAREYVYWKYGKENVCSVCDYKLFSYFIKQYGYKIVERKRLK